MWTFRSRMWYPALLIFVSSRFNCPFPNRSGSMDKPAGVGNRKNAGKGMESRYGCIISFLLVALTSHGFPKAKPLPCLVQVLEPVLGLLPFCGSTLKSSL